MVRPPRDATPARALRGDPVRTARGSGAAARHPQRPELSSQRHAARPRITSASPRSIVLRRVDVVRLRIASIFSPRQLACRASLRRGPCRRIPSSIEPLHAARAGSRRSAFRGLRLGICPTRSSRRARAGPRASGADAIVTSGGVVGRRGGPHFGRLSPRRAASTSGIPRQAGQAAAVSVSRPRVSDHGGAFRRFLPGTPVSSFVTFLIFVRPLRLPCRGARCRPGSYALRATSTGAPDPRQESCAPASTRRRARPVPAPGLGLLTSTTWADGLVENRRPRRSRRGAKTVRFLPFATAAFEPAASRAMRVTCCTSRRCRGGPGARRCACRTAIKERHDRAGTRLAARPRGVLGRY